MNPMLEKLKKLKKGKKELPDAEKEGKMAAVKSFADMAKEAMGKKVGGLKKVTVASDSPEGLKTGLEKAKELLGDKLEEEPATCEGCEEGCESCSAPAEEGAPEAALDESASTDELEAEIARLMELKKVKESESV